jgi:hypothetical protein
VAITLAAILGVILLGVVAVFQAGLALGAPWGAAAWGGQNPGVLPRPLRIASGVAAILVYPLIGLILLASAGLIDADWLPLQGTVVMWVLAILLGIGAVMNYISRSPSERFWGPVALTTAICFVIVALNA